MPDEPTPWSTPIHSLDELLSVTDCSSLEDAEAMIAGDYPFVIEFGDEHPDYLECYIPIMNGPNVYGSVSQKLPFTIEKLWADLDALELEWRTDLWLREMEECILLVEDFEVTLELDLKERDQTILRKVGRYVTGNGIAVQDDPRRGYDYASPMPGNRTVEEWFTQRFIRRCPGLRVTLSGSWNTRLNALRQGNYHHSDRSYGRIDLHRRLLRRAREQALSPKASASRKPKRRVK